jgi:hypothetical protein
MFFWTGTSSEKWLVNSNGKILQLAIPLSDILDITVTLNVRVSQYQLLLSCLVFPIYWRHFLALSLIISEARLIYMWQEIE